MFSFNIFETKVTYSNEKYFHPETGRQVLLNELPADYTAPTLPDVRIRHEQSLFSEKLAIEMPNMGKQIVNS